MEPAQPWYRTFFGPSFWALVADEYVAERTAVEVGYLAATLTELAPGRRVLDLGCGTGRHARGLAEHGFTVLGVDVSASALDAVEPTDGVAVVRQDVVAAHRWPGGEVDAAILVQGLGWGSDAEQRRLLVRLRERLAPGGVLILDLSAAAWILRNFVGTAEGESTRGRFRFDRSYDPLTGRVEGHLAHEPLDGPVTRLRQSVRLYLVEQALGLVRECGYEVLAVDGDFQRGGPVDLDSRYVQVVCRPVPVPPLGLAVTTATGVAGAVLDLHWTPDEGEFLHPSPVELWQRWWPQRPEEQLALAAGYAFDDPYGGHRGAAVLSEVHGVDLDSSQVVVGAGTTQLLMALAGLAHGGDVVAGRFGHPDLPAWARATGSRVTFAADPLDVPLPDGARAVSLVLLDRPTAAGSVVDLDTLHAAGVRLADRGALLVVDESYANYLGPAASVLSLVEQLPNLVVVRGISKGYCLGGLRFGYAVCSAELAPRVRAVSVPLATAATSTSFGLELLRAGDVFGALRERIGTVRSPVRSSLQEVGVDMDAGHPALPWLVARDPVRAARRLTELGIGHKHFEPADGQGPPLIRLALPLRDDRVEALVKVLAAGRSGR